MALSLLWCHDTKSNRSRLVAEGDPGARRREWSGLPGHASLPFETALVKLGVPRLIKGDRTVGHPLMKTS